MPFLNEVFEQVSETSSPSHPFNTRKTKMVNYVNRVYATTEPAESGLLSIRKVSPEIINQVPKNKLQTYQNKPTKLNNKFVEGAREQAAIQSFKYGSAAVRISNNFEIGIEAQNSFINRCSSAIDRISQNLLDPDDPIDLPIAVQNQVGSLRNSLSPHETDNVRPEIEQ